MVSYVQLHTECIIYKIIGAQNYLCCFNTDIWVLAMLRESIEVPPFYPSQFEILANKFISDNFGLSNRYDITSTICENVYLSMINNL